MIASDLFGLADMLESRAEAQMPLGIAEMRAVMTILRALAVRVDILESYPVPRAARLRIIDGGGDVA